jgi:peptide/nickel transport system substrate-binding protein
MQTPLQNVYMNGAGAPDGFAGWPKDAEVERLRRAFAATGDEGEHKRIAEDIHRRAAEAGFYMPLGQFVAASAWRADLTDVPAGPAMFLWGIDRSRT